MERQAESEFNFQADRSAPSLPSYPWGKRKHRTFARILALLLGVPFSIGASLNARAGVPDRESVFVAEPGEQDDLDKLFPDGPPAALFGEKDPAVIKNLGRLSDDKLQDLLNIYARIGNLTMGQAVAAEMLRRDPENEEALRARDELRIEVRTLDYNSKVAAALLRGEEIKDFDAIASEAGDLNGRKEYLRAQRLLTTLRTRYFADKPFPYRKDLAYAYHGQGQFSRAHALFQSILDDPDADAESKEDARAGIRDVEVGRMLVAGDAAIKSRNGSRALDLANRLLKIDPADPDAKVLKSRALSVLGNHDEAISILLALRGRPGAYFPQLRELGFAYFEAGRIEDAEEAFIELLNSPGHSEEARRDAMRSLADYRRDRLIREGSIALAQRDLTFAEVIAEELLSAEPNHPDVLLFLAEVMMHTDRVREAKDLLISVKVRDFPGTAFPAQGTLAYSFYQTGDIFSARDAFAELLNAPASFSPQEVADAADQWLQLDFLISPSFAADFGFVDESEGTGLHLTSRYQTAIQNQWRFFLESDADLIRLSSESPLGEKSAERYAARAGAERLFDNGLFARGYLGSSYSDRQDGEFLAGAGIGKYANYGVGWSLLARFKESAKNSLTLEYLDVRQHLIEFNIGIPISERLHFEGQLFGEQVDLYGENAGRGWGVETLLDYTIIKERPGRPRLALGYVGIYHQFDSNRPGASLTRDLGFPSPVLAHAFLDDIIDPLDHRHGARLTLSKRLANQLDIYAGTGLFYAFDNEQVQYEFTGGFTKWLSDRLKLYAEAYYDSAGQAASSGGGVIGVHGGVSIKF